MIQNKDLPVILFQMNQSKCLYQLIQGVNSSLRFKGTLTDMDSYGYLQFDSTYAYSPMLGATLHPAEEKVMIENSIIKLQGFHIYDKANTPFVINGNVDITNLLNPRLALNLNASNYEICRGLCGIDPNRRSCRRSQP